MWFLTARCRTSLILPYWESTFKATNCFVKSRVFPWGFRPSTTKDSNVVAYSDILTIDANTIWDRSVNVPNSPVRGVVNLIRRCTDLKSKNDFFRFFRFFQIFSDFLDFLDFFRFFQIFLDFFKFFQIFYFFRLFKIFGIFWASTLTIVSRILSGSTGRAQTGSTASSALVRTSDSTESKRHPKQIRLHGLFCRIVPQ